MTEYALKFDGEVTTVYGLKKFTLSKQMKGENAQFGVLLGTFFVFIIAAISYKVEESHLRERLLMDVSPKAGRLIEGVIWSLTGCFFAVVALVNVNAVFAKYAIIAIVSVVMVYATVGMAGGFFLRGPFMGAYEKVFGDARNEQAVIKIQKRNKCCGWGSPVVFPVMGNCTYKKACDEVIGSVFDERRGPILCYHLAMVFVCAYVLYHATVMDDSGSNVIE